MARQTKETTAQLAESSGMPATWVAARFGLDPVMVNALRRGGELVAFRRSGESEWIYPAWQFDAEGVRPTIARFLASARAEGLTGGDLEELLDRKVGLVGSRTVLDLLLAGQTDSAIAAIPAVASSPPAPGPEPEEAST